jgi:ubiquinone/menaquinone biosynthesis C-methylase UbiE
MTYYDSIASGYDELHEEEQLKKLELIKKNIDKDNTLESFRNPKNLLDVGCGSGISTRFFNIKEREGIDPSKELIKIAIKKDPKGKYLAIKAEQMNYDKEFDLIISLTAIQNFDNIDIGLEKIKRAGNRFILTFLKRSDKKKIIEKLIKKKFRIIKKLEEEKDFIYFCE